jgi:hypothetical protein
VTQNKRADKNMKFVLLVPILFVLNVQAIIEWEFRNSAAGYEETKVHVFIGTLRKSHIRKVNNLYFLTQKVELPLTMRNYCAGLIVKKEKPHIFGGFDAK